MSVALATMADYVNLVEQERDEQWKALSVIRGHSFPDCMRNNGKETSYRLFDIYGDPVKNKKGEIVDITSGVIGRKPSLTACLKQHGIIAPLTQLTGVGKDAVRWFFDYQVGRYQQDGIRLDEGAMTFINDNVRRFVPRDIMLNKHQAYIHGDKSAFAGDPDIPRYMLAISLENDIKGAAIVTAKAVTKSHLSVFKRFLGQVRVLDPMLADEMENTFTETQDALSQDVPLHLSRLLWR